MATGEEEDTHLHAGDEDTEALLVQLLHLLQRQEGHVSWQSIPPALRTMFANDLRGLSCHLSVNPFFGGVLTFFFGGGLQMEWKSW